MPKSPDGIVIGGGVIGLAIARALARDGLDVTVLERAVCGGEASWAGAGIISPCNPHRDDPFSRFHDRSLDLYPAYCEALRDESGIDPQYERCGRLELLFTPDCLGIARSDAVAAEERTMPDGRLALEMRTPEQTAQIESAASREILGSLQCHRTAQVRNPRLLQAMKVACTRAGATVRERAGVDGIVVERGRVIGVRIGDQLLSGGTVILCAGAWSSQIDSRLGELMPVHPVRGQMVLLEVDRRPFSHVVARGKTYLVARCDGHVLLGSTEEPEAGFSKRNTPKGVAGLMEMGLRLVPALAEASVAAMWAGLRPGTPDDKPYIGPVPDFAGLIAATGHFRSGLTLAPAMADVVVSMVHDRPYDLDLSCCFPGRP